MRAIVLAALVGLCAPSYSGPLQNPVSTLAESTALLTYSNGHFGTATITRTGLLITTAHQAYSARQTEYAIAEVRMIGGRVLYLDMSTPIYLGAEATNMDYAVYRLWVGSPDDRYISVRCITPPVNTNIFSIGFPGPAGFPMRIWSRGYIATPDIGFLPMFSNAVGVYLNAHMGSSGSATAYYDRDTTRTYQFGVVGGVMPMATGGMTLVSPLPKELCEDES